MSIRKILKGLAPYSYVIKKRNKDKDFAQRIAQSVEKK